MPRTPIAQIVKMIGRELGTGLGPSEEVLVVGPDWRTLGPPRKPSEACSLRSAANARTFRSAAVALTRIAATGVRTEFAPDSPLEEVEFEPSVPRMPGVFVVSALDRAAFPLAGRQAAPK